MLGGGGAKGAAHVGVLTVLEELRIPIDCVVGTSMGALVGGTYASGQTAAEVEKAIRGISFQRAIAFEGERKHQPMRRKLAGDIYSNSLEFGLRDGGFIAPSGFISSQNIEQTIAALVSRSLGVRDFDELPIPFRAVATDMQTGEMVVLASGDLPHALRASMSVPGVFAPVTLDGRVLGDGGLTRNVPVDIARQVCADVVIAVSVPNPVPTAEELRSPLTMFMRTLDVLVGANERQQLDTLVPGDVSIIVPMGDITSSAFHRAAEAIPLGREAALHNREKLSRYSLPEDEYLAWREATSRGERDKVQLAGVQVHGLERVQERFVLGTLDLAEGSVVDQQVLGEGMTRLYATAEFERAEFALRGDESRPTLDVYLKEKSWGPHIVRFDIGLTMGTDSNTAFVIGGDYLKTWINPLGGELHGSLYFGRTSTLSLALYQPLEPRAKYFVEPGITVRRSLEDLFFDDEAVARYRFDRAVGSLDLGRVFGTRAELRAGVVSGMQSAERDIAIPQLPEVSSEGYGGWTARGVFDTRDRVDLTSQGLLGRVAYFHSDESLGSETESSYEKLDALARRFLSIREAARVLAGGRRHVFRLDPADLRPLRRGWTDQSAGLEPRTAARRGLLARLPDLRAQDRGALRPVRPGAVPGFRARRRRRARAARRRTGRPRLHRDRAARRTHAARTAAAVLLRDEHRRLAGGARDRPADRGGCDHRPGVVTLTACPAARPGRPTGRSGRGKRVGCVRPTGFQPCARGVDHAAAGAGLQPFEGGGRESFRRVTLRLGQRVGCRAGEAHRRRESVEVVALVEGVHGLERHQPQPVLAAPEIERALADRLAEGVLAHDRDFDPGRDRIDVDLACGRRRHRS